MKKDKAKNQEQKRSRRLSLSRETILVLNDPAFLELARGGMKGTSSQPGGICETIPSAATGC